MWRALSKPRNLLLLGTGVISVYCIRQNDYSLSDIGLVRFMRAGFTAGTMIVDYKIAMSRSGDPGGEEYRQGMKKCHKRSADRILDLCRRNGGVFIKVGQHVASLQYLLPEEYTSTLSVLHSKAPESDLSEIRKVFKKDIGQELEDVFTDFNEKPCGAASLAQVYKARLKSTGELVAVKIQHRKVKDRSLVDIATMEFFLRVAHRIFPDFHLMWLVEETKKNLPKELDFLHEAENALRVKQLFQHLTFLHIPRIFPQFSSEKVLTMEFCEGIQIDDVKYIRDNDIDSHEICRKLGKVYSEMIFKFGFIHADPHPGNVLVRKEDGEVKLVLLDHGLYSKLDDDFRADYCQLWTAIMKPDTDEIRRVCTRMGVGDLFGLFACMVTSRSYKSVTSGIARVKPSDAEMREIKEYAASLIFQISQVLDRMPRAMLLILKTNDLLRAIEHRLGAHHRSDAFLEMARCCTWTIYEKRVRHTTSEFEHLTAMVQLYWVLFKIRLFEVYLICREWFRGKHHLHQ